MKPASYWEHRSAEVSEAAFKKADAYENVMLREYTHALDRIKERLAAFYGRYATNDGISLADARKQLTGKELTAHRMTLEEFTAKAKANTDGKWTQELNRASFKARVSRLEALELQVRQEVEVLAGSRQAGTGKLLGDIYEDTYYKTGYELQRGLGIGISFARINKPGLETVLGTEFAGSNWSKRIWGDRDKLMQELRTKMSQAFIRGEPLERLSSDVAKRMDVSLSNARRLVQTESAFFAGQATMDGYKKSKVIKAYKIVATLDRSTSDICQDMDGQVFNLEDMRVGETYPPFHSHCRTTTVAEFDNTGITDLGKRLARDDDGSVYKVPSTMKYPEWAKRQGIDMEPTAGSTGVAVPPIESGRIQSRLPTIEDFESAGAVEEPGSGVNRRFNPRATYYAYLPDVGEDVLEELAEINREIARTGYKEARETLVVVDRESGSEISRLSGSVNAVKFTAEMDAVLRAAPPRSVILTHNHPGGTRVNVMDSINMGDYPAIKVVMAVGHNGGVSFISAGSSAVDGVALRSRLRQIFLDVEDRLRKDKKYATMSKTAQLEYFDYQVLLSLADEMGWTYGEDFSATKYDPRI
ncbi:phage putative head morphogenesis protein, SPP1 gp7 family [Paenibacillaceae bacterium GAS479]|nr:phage putative head morphogenesis protein, SPP1 gp7 family [Paenibacillaceae bacterium GAS479]